MRYRIMLAGWLVVAAAWNVQADPPEADQARVKKLIAQLGSERYSERRRAESELDSIGAPALTQLRIAAAGDDNEVSDRARYVISRLEQKIAADAMLAPKRLRLNVARMPVKDAIAELTRLSGYTIEYTGTQERPLTLDTGEVTFWEALDQLCRRSDITENLPTQTVNQPMPIEFGGGKRRIMMVEPRAPLPPQNIVLSSEKPIGGPVFRAGSVRIRVIPSTIAKVPAAGGETAVALDIAGEQRLLDFGVIGTPFISKAIDEHGQSLTLISESIPQVNQYNNGDLVMLGNGMIVSGNGVPLQSMPQRTLPMKFKQAARPSRTLKELSGKLTVQALGEPEAIVTIGEVMKSAAVGKRVEGKAGYAMTIQSVEKLPDNQGVKFNVIIENSMDPVPNGLGRRNFARNINGSRYNSSNIPKLIEADGKVCAGELIGQSTSFINNQLAYTLMLSYRPAGEPSQLVLYANTAIVFEIPFTLKDVPLP